MIKKNKILLFLLLIIIAFSCGWWLKIKKSEEIYADFRNAVLTKNIQQIQGILEKYNIEINSMIYNGKPLLFAVLSYEPCQEKIWDVVSLMLAKGCDINSKDSNGVTFLMYAITSKAAPDIIEKILNAGADINAKDNYGNTPFHYVSYSANLGDKGYAVRCTELFLKYGADINAENSQGESSLVPAVSSDNIEMVKLLLRSGCKVNPSLRGSKTALHAAAENGNIEIVKLLIDKGAVINPPSYNSETPFSLAIFKKHYNVAKFLIRKGADLKLEDNNRILIYVVEDKNCGFAKYLINKGTSVNTSQSDISPLSAAASIGDNDMIKLLLEHNANPNIGGGTPPLMYSVLYSNHEISELLLKHGADPDVKDSKGISPRSVVTERIADPVFANEKSSYEKILKMMNEKKVKSE